MRKKGFYFLLDAIFAAALLIMGLLAVSEIYDYSSDTRNIDHLSKDLLNSLTTLKIEDFNESNANISFIVSEISNNNVTPENTVLEQVGEYWARNETAKASQLLSSVLNHTNIDFNIEILAINAYRSDYDSIYKYNYSGIPKDLVSSRRMVSGIEKGLPLEGSTSTAYLRKINNKRTSAYAYFGGFIGQGNITVSIRDLPADFGSDKISRIIMEADSAADFDMYINGQFCGRLNITLHNMSADTWDITGCNSSMSYGQNNFTLEFYGEINRSFIAGGYIKVDYYTDEMNVPKPYGTGRYYFPYVDGLVNIYDSFYVPGTLHTLSIYLHYTNNQTTYLSIGNTKVYDNTSNGTEEMVTIDNATLSSFPYFLDYNAFSNTTIPIRFSSINTSTYVSMGGGNADIILITDLSGSMRWRIGYSDSVDGVIRGCGDANLYNDDTRRISLAKCLDKDFIDTIMNYTGNRMWLVDFSNSASFYYSDDALNLKNEIDTYPDSPSGATCIACAINRAYNLLNTYSNSSRNKYVIVMSDGIPSYCAGRYWSWFTGWTCLESSTGTTGYSIWGCSGSSSECENNDCIGPSNNAINSANRTRIDLNATIFSVGFGDFSSCTIANRTLATVAEVGNGTYYSSQNASELQDIYDDIATQIITASQISQLVTITGNFTYSTLYPDSYIEYNYTPIISPTYANVIEITMQTEKFGTCNISVGLMEEMTITDAKISSYSGVHWTDLLQVNNATVYNLSTLGAEYYRLGDPYIIQVPVNTLLNSGAPNEIYLRTGDNPNNFTGCPKNTSIIYTAIINSTTSRSEVLQQSIGCIWTIAFENNETAISPIPGTYSGNNTCSYTDSSISYKAYDSYDSSVYAILEQLDFDNDGLVDINLNTEDLEVIVTTVEAVPYLWGPSIIEARVWR